ncbi:hypothetical protein GCM10010302_43570 [Streptomyces polychromogenes]|uniref:D-inositol 3-phosphate glycosyltransferase n=1 Tax=Streptomyces polychromogenes TaxID=67342 RepID=A0ABP3F6V6_9ACTN
MIRRLRIALIASARFPIREPFAGGLEAHTWALASALRRRGHRISLFAAPGSDPCLGVRELAVHAPRLSAAARADLSMTDPSAMDEHHAYLRLMLDLAHGDGSPSYDLVHNNSLHYLPVAMAPAVPAPVVTTLHTPPTPWLESAIQTDPTGSGVFTAVSAHTARSWQPLVHAGHLRRTELAALVGSARATLVTPCWDEPYGLVVAESLACGTPVAGFDRGALAEILTPDCGRLVPYPDVPALAAALDETMSLSRRACRERAESFCSLGRMTDRYESLYEELLS